MSSTLGDKIGSLEGRQCFEGIPSCAVEDVHHCGGCSVIWGYTMIILAVGTRYFRGMLSVLLEIFSSSLDVMSYVKYHQYSGTRPSVHWNWSTDISPTVRNTFKSADDIHLFSLKSSTVQNTLNSAVQTFPSVAVCDHVIT